MTNEVKDLQRAMRRLKAGAEHRIEWSVNDCQIFLAAVSVLEEVLETGKEGSGTWAMSRLVSLCREENIRKGKVYAPVVEEE